MEKYPKQFVEMKYKPLTPKVGVGVILRKENKILLLLRKNTHGSGLWSLPGGHMELGEEFLDTCKREVLEETGVSIDGIKHIAFINHIFNEEKLHYVTLFFEAIWDQSQNIQNMEPDKSECFRWFTIEEIPFIPNIFESLPTVIKKIYKK